MSIVKKNIFVYLRSNGYEEYKAILGFFGPFFYHIMYFIVTFKSKIISCQKRLVKNKKKYYLVFPSEINKVWLKKSIKPKLDKPRLLYVGRMKIEKGIYSLIKILEQSKENFKLSIVGSDKENNNKNNSIIYYTQQTNNCR